MRLATPCEPLKAAKAWLVERLAWQRRCAPRLLGIAIIATACLLLAAGAAAAQPFEPPRRVAESAPQSTHPLLRAWREAVAHSYLALRAGLQFYPTEDGASQISGYSPTEAQALALSGAYRSQLELSGFGTFVLGTNYGPRSLLRGRLRQEYEFGYRSYENRVCFQAIADTPMEEAAPTRAEAQRLLEQQLVERCPRQSDYVWTFMLNTHYDVPLGRLPAALHAGFGIGYLLASNRLGFQRLAADAQEPWFDSAANMLRFGKAADSDAEDANPRLAAAANRRANNTELAEPELVGSGLFVPVYAGFSWRTDAVSGLPITLEVLYRYAAHAPRGFQGTHALSWGGRYRF